MKWVSMIQSSNTNNDVILIMKEAQSIIATIKKGPANQSEWMRVLIVIGTCYWTMDC